jgi:DnaJ homolog subfamily B member 4
MVNILCFSSVLSCFFLFYPLCSLSLSLLFSQTPLLVTHIYKIINRHPDRNQGNKEEADKMFKAISEAYEVLSDPNKRTIYDTYGEAGLKGQPSGSSSASGFPGSGAGGFPGGFPGFASSNGGTTFSFSTSGGPGGFTPTNAEDIFAQFFGSRSPFGMAGGPGGGGLDMDDHPFGGMGGMGGMPKGFGRSSTFPQQQQQQPQQQTVKRALALTLEELFSGTTKKLKVTRKILDGATGRQMAAEKVLTVDIKAGWKAGTKITFAGEGDELHGGGAQDLVFEVAEKPHARVKRDGDHLRMEMTVGLVESLTGFNKRIETLDGTFVEVRGGSGSTVVQPGAEIVVRGEGMPISKQPGKRGDLIVTVKVVFPSSLSENQKVGIKNALGNL